ncbi:hypothetical protein EVJ58_g7862 [Rhodofomes roseus]|uniref:Uncharacterized protein n=1 Tax=Rhodofomes roseus TaxID=34475 RepID=A0A4Y9Y3S1_9APHY|nr:hypothetical protein EVJ58_g7862 [Rhodofomes roseus]
MSGKSISTSTLSLRFMQNAQRAKLQAQVEAEQAKVKDDAEWSVSQEVRDAWGIGSSSSSTSAWSQTKTQKVTYEASYVPFVFGDEDEEREDGEDEADPSLGPSGIVRGRRTFNERGQEVIRKEAESNNEAEEPAEEVTGWSNPLKGKGRPASISGFRAPLPTKSKDGKKARTKTAQQLIRETAATTPVSLSSAPRSGTTDMKREPSGFMKPAGVDAPPPTSSKSGQKKRHRDRDAPTEPAESKGKKRKKKAETELTTVE